MMRSQRWALVAAVIVVIAGMASATPAMAGAATPKWKSTALPWTVAGPVTGAVLGVSCGSSTACVAVGHGTIPRSSGATMSMVETLAGGSWTEGILPLPAGATSAQLNAVSCTGASKCVAVGEYFTTESHALVESLKGKKWTAVTGIDPAGATLATLTGVSCVKKACTAVGTSSTSSFVEQLDGSTWSATRLALPAGKTAMALNSVSCPTATGCTAVGTATGSSGTGAVIESEAGTIWSPTVSASPSSLASVSCNTSGACVAVGTQSTSGLEDVRTSGTWTSTLSSATEALASVWCAPTAPLACTAWGVGPFIETLGSGTWTTTPTSTLIKGTSIAGTCAAVGSCVALETPSSDPGVAVLDQSGTGWTSALVGGPPDATLDSVSCSAVLCVAIGGYTNTSGGMPSDFLESQVGGTWTEVGFPLPNPYDFPAAVSCQGSTCVLVTGDGVATSTDGVHWTTGTLPLPSGANAALTMISGVSCWTTGGCVAVGNSSSGLMIETLADGTWSDAVLPEPAGGSDGTLRGVSCVSATACQAVGGVDSSSAGPLVATLTGTTWVATALPPAPGASSGSFYSVSCPATTFCAAVGSWYPSDGGDGNPLVATLSSSGWVQTAQTPVGGPSGTNASVSCPTAGTCDDVQSNFVTSWLEQLSGGTWTTVALPLPKKAPTAAPEGVICLPGGARTVVGYAQLPSTTPGEGIDTVPFVSSLT
jgi:hypothetical protein